MCALLALGSLGETAEREGVSFVVTNLSLEPSTDCQELMRLKPIIFSDQFLCPKIMQEEGQLLKLPDTKRTLLFTFNVPDSGDIYPKDMEALPPLMNTVISSIDKTKKFRLNREGKQIRTELRLKGTSGS